MMGKPISNAYNVDCVAWMKTMPDKFFDLAIVDPPYGSCTNAPSDKLNGARLKKYVVDDMKPGAWDIAPSEEYFTELFRVSERQIIWGGNYFQLPPSRCFVVWVKSGIPADFTFAQAEYAWCSFDGGAKVYEETPLNMKGRIHVCQKPIGLYGFLLKHFAYPGDKILDTHMGSQSSRIAAFKAGFDFWGCEINDAFFKAGCRRFEKECLGVERVNGHTITNYNLFEEYDD